MPHLLRSLNGIMPQSVVIRLKLNNIEDRSVFPGKLFETFFEFKFIRRYGM